MKYKLFGHTGLRVSELCLGTMTFGEAWGFGASKAECNKVFNSFADAGGNFIDTADQYSDGVAEQYLADFIGSERERFVLATKYTSAMSTEHPGASGNSRKHMMEAVNASLQRLRTDYIDLLWVHAWDGLTPVEEIMRGLDDLISMGKVNYIGFSNAPAWVMAQANMMAEWRGWTRFAGMQLKYNLMVRDIEAEHLPLARQQDMAICPWSPLANGILSGKYRRDDVAATADSERAKLLAGRVPENAFALVDAVSEVASQLSVSHAQVALAWLRSRDPRIIPLIGARTEQQLQDNLACVDVSLNAEQIARLEQASDWQPRYPQNYLAADDQRYRAFGGFADQILNHRNN